LIPISGGHHKRGAPTKEEPSKYRKMCKNIKKVELKNYDYNPLRK
jgi:hypothetical protein